MAKHYLKPDYLFETSWEVCNKVGGIHTVISTKARLLTSEYKNGYICIGPDVYRGTHEHPEFVEDKDIFKFWREKATDEGLRIKIGRWKIVGSPIAILVDFTPLFSEKDTIFAKLWETYKLDSLSGQWDYVEPALFGYAVGRVIESFLRFNLTSSERVICQFHEWMTGTGILYLKQHVPQAGTVFTTHATVVGRALAGNNFPLYRNLKQYDANQISKDFNIRSKQSLEKITAAEADVFTTVSQITANECSQFLGKDVDLITPNGFEDVFVPGEEVFKEKQKTAREKFFKVANALCNTDIPSDTLCIATSGRYEFRNKGIDVFIDSLGKLNEDKQLKKNVLAFLMVPAGHYGPRKDLLEKLQNPENKNAFEDRYVTHTLHNTGIDLIINRLRNSGLFNRPEDMVKVIFVPCYLDGRDGIFDLSYYDFITGLDLTAFPSYYEPWGYTPLESLAFHIPTITTTLTGFGVWVNDHFKEPDLGIVVIPRTDDNDANVVLAIVNSYRKYLQQSSGEYDKSREKAFEISRIALWENLVDYYRVAYHKGLEIVETRADKFVVEAPVEHVAVVIERPLDVSPQWKKIIVQSKLPARLDKLRELTMNLWWSWDTEAQELFESIDPEIWYDVQHNPFLFFECVSYKKYLSLEKDKEFLHKLDSIYHRFQAYMAKKDEKQPPKVAYFSMEYGLHDSIKIYSGGLGILAGDYLKEASDKNVDIVAIGLLYRFGYFKQLISMFGEQISLDDYQQFSKLPVTMIRDEQGVPVTVLIALPGRTLHVRIWKVCVGRIDLFLLDTEMDENQPQDRGITHHLYGGTRETRLLQELVLGIGGIRALVAMGYKPDLYHSNEGHSAFIGIERIRRLIQKLNLTFEEAKEIVRASTLFTTHTPVPAGHDAFPEDMLRTYIPHYADRLKIPWQEFMALGRRNPNDPNEEFNMSYLAISLSQEVNGVSMLHGQVSREMFAPMWKGYLPEELYIGYVTNGVHLATWTAKEWKALYEKLFGAKFYEKQTKFDEWKKIYTVPDKEIWDLKQSLRTKLIDLIHQRAKDNWIKRHENPKHMMEALEKLNDNILTIGFARRFATYKRACLLFRNPERLADIVNNEERPVQFFFAGKAHPHDKAGQELIKKIVEISKRAEFRGRVLFLQNYDMQLSSQLVQGVDIWLNTPTRPMEASGTSGMKAVMNGTLHFSVLDGWWVEGYQEGAGWALPQEQDYAENDLQDELDAETLYQILENEVVPAFYERNEQGIPEKWVQFIKNCIANVSPRFTTERMINDYQEKFYSKLYNRSTKMQENDYAMAKNLVRWKSKFIRKWKNLEVVSYAFNSGKVNGFQVGEKYYPEVEVDLNGLNSYDINLDLVITRQNEAGNYEFIHAQPFEVSREEGGKAWYKTKIIPTMPGNFSYGIRVYPQNEDLPHRQDFPYVKWV
jgi:phosphorylase/glycogen(starch) synthase